MPARQSGHTGKREMFNCGLPQIRQSEGNSTENSPSENRRPQFPAQPDPGEPDPVESGAVESSSVKASAPPDKLSRRTIGRPAAVALARLARIRSSLLLKTASFITPQTPARPRPICQADSLLPAV